MMINKTKTKTKQNRLGYDENGGLILMKNWSPILRWISLLPALLITFIMVKFLFLGTVLAMLEKESFLLSLYVGAITSGLVYMAMVDVAGSVAPKGRVLTSIVTAVVLMIFIISFTLLALYAILNVDDYIEYKTHLMIALGLSIISNILGVLLGISNTKDRQKNAPQIPSQVPPQTISNNIVS
ncbi:hypothetical protein RHO14_06850 [Orbus wheelerorum]|uniref:hypothetical protein n=1 Tax=Orbus wheelerorum TaxID=3074111 RepID=UPI00370DD31A